MKNSVDTHLGSIIVDNNVIANFAGNVALECYGVVGMAAVNVRDGFVGLLKKDSMAKGIIVSCENNKVTINLHIIVAFGCGVVAVANNLMSEVKYKVEQFAGLDVEKVNVFIEGVKVVD
ncbi:MAG: Asp23/Gls24 family envelope stress response protein [Lachnospiraceae bacterium]|nr:Asp23/Gls24 family envelope stress response protein [Lachnospiraceae bacterium]